MKVEDFEAIALPHLRSLLGTALRVMCNRGEAEDAVQETFLRAWKSIDRFMPGTNVTDPVSGEYAINLPIDVIQSAQALANSYAPEYGKFAGAVTSIETRRGGDEWKVQFQSAMGSGGRSRRVSSHRAKYRM